MIHQIKQIPKLGMTTAEISTNVFHDIQPASISARLLSHIPTLGISQILDVSLSSKVKITRAEISADVKHQSAIAPR